MIAHIGCYPILKEEIRKGNLINNLFASTILSHIHPTILWCIKYDAWDYLLTHNPYKESDEVNIWEALSVYLNNI